MRVLFALIFFAWAALAHASQLPVVGGEDSAPIGYAAFCKSWPSHCHSVGSVPQPATLTDELMNELVEINVGVNHTVAPITDLELYGNEEVWTVAVDKGDCEDYVLRKRLELIGLGWHPGNLLITVVFDELGDGHAVLLVRTSEGDLVLDNKIDDIRLWWATAYHFVKRQSVEDPNKWIAISDPRFGPTGALRIR